MVSPLDFVLMNLQSTCLSLQPKSSINGNGPSAAREMEIGYTG